jgi:kynurenine 3-monooxygenase
LIKEFSTCRKANTDAISDMAVKNFIEMRDLVNFTLIIFLKVNDKFFKFKKECESKIAKRFPDFISKYSLVAFSLVPYYIAMKRGEVHDEILD